MKKWIVWSALLICCAVAQSAQAQIIVKGRVINLSGAGLPGASVAETTTCTNPFGGTVTCSGSAQTDANGYYEYSVPFCPQGSSCLIRNYNHTVSKPGYSFSGILSRVDPNTGERRREHVGIEGPLLANVSAADYLPLPLLSSEMITAAFGAGLATATEVALTLPLPTRLANRSVLVSDANGVEKAAPLLFVSPTQINYLVPSGLATPGPLVIKVTDGTRPVQGGFASLGRIRPGIFTANADGQGVAAAVVQRVKPDGSQTYEPVAQFDAAQNRFVFAPIDFGPEADQLILVLFGTGWRNRTAQFGVTVTVGGMSVQVEYAGLQPTIPGLDQINARLPRSLAGRGETTVVVTVETLSANTVRVSFK